jgi:hypothetical protein
MPHLYYASNGERLFSAASDHLQIIRTIECHWILCFAETVRYCTKVQ